MTQLRRRMGAARAGLAEITAVLALATLLAAPVALAQTARLLSQPEMAFLEEAAQNGHAEVESGKLALAKSVNTQIKSFAQQMVEEHGKLGDELAALAASKGVKVPSEPSLTQKGSIKLLSTAAGERFDQRYARSMGVAAHEDAIRLFQKAAAKAGDADVRAFAVKTLPKLQQHLSMARDLRAVADRNARAKTGGASN